MLEKSPNFSPEHHSETDFLDPDFSTKKDMFSAISSKPETSPDRRFKPIIHARHWMVLERGR